MMNVNQDRTKMKLFILKRRDRSMSIMCEKEDAIELQMRADDWSRNYNYHRLPEWWLLFFLGVTFKHSSNIAPS